MRYSTREFSSVTHRRSGVTAYRPQGVWKHREIVNAKFKTDPDSQRESYQRCDRDKMKTTTRIVLAGGMSILLASNVALAGRDIWIKVNDQVSIDSASLKRTSPGRAAFWVQFRNSGSSGDGIASTRAHITVTCKDADEYEEDSRVTYTTLGDVSDESATAHLRPLVPGTLGASAVIFACDYLETADELEREKVQPRISDSDAP